MAQFLPGLRLRLKTLFDYEYTLCALVFNELFFFLTYLLLHVHLFKSNF